MGRGGRQLPEAPTGARRQWAADRALRAPMRSPGRPEPSRAVQREFWRLIATGVSTADASVGVGVSVPVGTRWFRHAGGMPPLSLADPTGRSLCFAEREEIAPLRVQDEPPWVCWRLGLLDSNHGVVGLLGSVERCFELCWGDVCAVAV